MDELTGDLVTAAQAALKQWHHYRRGILTVSEFLDKNDANMVALQSAVEELDEEE